MLPKMGVPSNPELLYTPLAAQGPHSYILMMGGSDRGSYYFYTPKNPNFRICLPKKIPQCFCISKFYYLTSGKLKHANFNFGFGQKQNYKLRLCYFSFEYNSPKNPSVVFATQKNPGVFHRPKKIPFGQNVRPKKILPTPPSYKICQWGPWNWLCPFEC